MFLDLYNDHSFDKAIQKIEGKTSRDVEMALSKSKQRIPFDFEDYLSLLAPISNSYLEEMANLSKEHTLERFGKTIQIYAPMYLSNECRSSCLYCGFSFENKIPRITLTIEEVEKEAMTLKDKGISHVLILTGEEYSKTSVSYIEKAVKTLNKYFASISIEIYPLKTDEYKRLIEAGVDGLTLYQETYNQETYHKYHIRGMKKNMEYRLNGPDRGGLAGFRRLGIGALLGLANPLGEMYFLGLHAMYLTKEYWKSSVLVSLPRIRRASGNFDSIVEVKDREFVKYLFALRLFLNDLGLVVSTRERPFLRDNLIGLGVTTISAGSKTQPGGYNGSNELEQFEIEDTREVSEIVDMLKNKGYDPVIKDFDRAFLV
ncbi:MAG: 2-iminoacetate synthase ThiH [Leptospiraceae bacterium]|nr:2-iminoacetate synthase ThiH [Leptospiraceae bacterium]MCP5496066.1 2-iminoacetate synthase ThiH [Leptospiraceae bacterium]